MNRSTNTCCGKKAGAYRTAGQSGWAAFCKKCGVTWPLTESEATTINEELKP